MKKCDFLEVHEGENFSIQLGKSIKLLRVYLTTGSRVKTAKEKIQFSKSKMTAVCYGPNFLLEYLIEVVDYNCSEKKI